MNAQKPKVLQLQEGFAPLPLPRAVPWTPLHGGSALRPPL